MELPYEPLRTRRLEPMSASFHSGQDPIGGILRLTGTEAHHLVRVARRRTGEIVDVLNGKGTLYTAVIESIESNQVVLRVLVEKPEAGEWPVPLMLAVAMPKGERADWLVEKVVEVGVARLVPLITDRSVVNPGAPKLERLRKKVIEATKQSGRSRLMEISEPERLEPWLNKRTGGVRHIALPGREALTRTIIDPGRPDAVVLTVGPEGGFTEDEQALAIRAGWGPIGLGPSVLRVETAATVGCALLAQFYLS